MSATPQNFMKVEDYFSKVDVYSKICKNNYMYHKEIFNLFKSFIENIFGKKPFNLLDLGCGEAFFMAEALRDTNINSYDGYDLSAESIEKAKSNMSNITCSKNFFMIDLSKDFLDSKNKTNYYDIIWTSYALHHLNYDEKKRFLKKCFDKLKQNSSLILVDFVNDYTSREECFRHYKENVERKWIELTSEDKQYLYEHVLKFDFPESFSTYKEIGEKTGFKNLKKIFQKDSWAYMMFLKSV